MFFCFFMFHVKQNTEGLPFCPTVLLRLWEMNKGMGLPRTRIGFRDPDNIFKAVLRLPLL